MFIYSTDLCLMLFSHSVGIDYTQATQRLPVETDETLQVKLKTQDTQTNNKIGST